MDRNSFLLGFILGAVLIAGIGYIFQRISWLRTKKIVAGKKQRIDAYTESTPSEVVRSSGAAQVQVFFLFLLILGLLAGCFWVVSSLLSGQ
jgi:hypothetical protein